MTYDSFELEALFQLHVKHRCRNKNLLQMKLIFLNYELIKNNGIFQ